MELEVRLLVEELQRAPAVRQRRFRMALALVEEHEQLTPLVSIKGIGEKLAVSLLSSLGIRSISGRPGVAR